MKQPKVVGTTIGVMVTVMTVMMMMVIDAPRQPLLVPLVLLMV